MLVVTRKEGERIVTGDELRLPLWSRSGGRFGLGSKDTPRSGSSGTKSNRGQLRYDYRVDLACLSPPSEQSEVLGRARARTDDHVPVIMPTLNYHVN
jgi:hypothetical protein